MDASFIIISIPNIVRISFWSVKKGSGEATLVLFPLVVANVGPWNRVLRKQGGDKAESAMNQPDPKPIQMLFS